MNDEAAEILEKGTQHLITFFDSQPYTVSSTESRAYKNPKNSMLNRYYDVPCIDRTRVKLKPNKFITSNYIHANYVDLGQHSRALILTQGPLPLTISHFWNMIWCEDCYIIVMTTRCIEKNREKCSKYWPDKDEEINFGDIEVKCIHSTENEKTIDSTFQLKRNNKTKFVYHMLYKNWPDLGSPDVANFLEFISQLYITIQSKLGQGTCLIHCSAGIGRSGTVAVILNVIENIQTQKKFEIIEKFKLVRSQRAAAVQSANQYIFINKISLMYAKKMQLIDESHRIESL
ncbi:hypothetical protein A3Q56_06082 [Intoshia linei]|uniref:Uncharacterized protein n=1 Tax=Intoshia linei TaxID=1819745 RepID=A0A177AXQ1_9BILA|nr:hypothetical protein A3Q56_06082 [Intoshia linei]